MTKTKPKVSQRGVIWFVVLSVILIAIMHLQNQEKPIPASQPEVNTIHTQDFPSVEQGTFRGQLQKNYFKEPIDDIVVLFSSAKLPGMSLIYYPQEKRLAGGTPVMVAENVVLFDGVAHDIAYSFKKDGKQFLVYDGQLVGISDYQGYIPSVLNGMVIGTPITTISPSMEKIEVE